MTDVFIGTKKHRNIEKLSLARLEHLLQLANVEIDNYKRCVENDKTDHMKRISERWLKELNNRCETIRNVIHSKENKEKQS